MRTFGFFGCHFWQEEHRAMGLVSHTAQKTRAWRDAQQSFCFRRDRIWVDLACLEMEENVYLK